jgi:hypothetical protein
MDTSPFGGLRHFRLRLVEAMPERILSRVSCLIVVTTRLNGVKPSTKQTAGLPWTEPTPKRSNNFVKSCRQEFCMKLRLQTSRDIE